MSLHYKKRFITYTYLICKIKWSVLIVFFSDFYVEAFFHEAFFSPCNLDSFIRSQQNLCTLRSTSLWCMSWSREVGATGNEMRLSSVRKSAVADMNNWVKLNPGQPEFIWSRDGWKTKYPFGGWTPHILSIFYCGYSTWKKLFQIQKKTWRNLSKQNVFANL